MSMYSTIEGTSSLPSINGVPNVSQYGWTAFEIENYKQLGEYVDQCKAYFDGITANTAYIKVMYEAIFEIKGQVDIIFNTINTQANTIKAQYDTINGWYNQIGLWENIIRAMQTDVTNKHNEVIQMTTQISLVGIEVQKMHDAVMISEVNAKASELGAETWFKRSYDLYLDLQKQQVYRGLWNPNSGAYPDGEGTNSYWDVILNPNQEQFEYDNKIWYFGDRLVYVLATNKFEQLEAGLSNVKSVNGKTGAVTLVAGDVGAYDKAETDAKLALKTDITYVDDKLSDKADKSTSINGKFLTGDIILSPADVKAISATPIAVPSTVTHLTDRSIISTNNILTLTSAFDDGPVNTVISGQIRTMKSTQSTGSSVIQELWMQDGISYLRVGSTNVALDSFTWVGGDANGWRKVYDSSNRPTAQEAGAMPVSFADLAEQNISTFLSDKVGIYSQHLNAHATEANGYPPRALAGVLEVFPGPYAVEKGVVQRYTNYLGLGSWTRLLSNDGVNFSEWIGLPSINIGNTNMITLTAFDWQQQDFITGASYLTNCTGWVNGPAEAVYPADYSVTITVETINDSANIIEVTTASNTTSNEHYHIYKILIVGSKGSRTFTVRKVHTSAQPVPVSEGGTGTNNADAALVALGGADIVTSGSDITLLSKANPARDKNIRIHANNNDIRTVGADGTVARFYNDKTYRPTAADFGGLFVNDGNEVNFPTNAGESTLYFNYRNVGSEISKISFNNGKSQINGYCDINVGNIDATGNLTTNAVLTSYVRVDTTADGNSDVTPDGVTYLGYKDDNGHHHHYLRGKGLTHVDTLQGLSVYSGPVHSYKGVSFSNKAYATYDYESMAGWDTSLTTNHLRKFRAHGSASIYHEAVIEEHADPRASGGISWWTGNGPETFLASINKTGEITARAFRTYGGSNVINIDTTPESSAYMKGTNGGKNLWILGKTNDLHEVEFYLNHPTDAVVIGQKFVHNAVLTNVQNNYITAAYPNYFQVDGSAWAKSYSHSYADQWANPAPVYVNFGSVPGESDYYPIVRGVSVASGAGYTTQVDLGMIRSGPGGAGWGAGILRVGSAEQGSASDAHAIYQFNMNGGFYVPSLVNVPYVETAKITSFGVHTDNYLGGSSIAFGDTDTGIRQRYDGQLEIVTNSSHVGTFSFTGLELTPANEARGVYVHGTRSGSGNSLVQGVVDGWPDWNAWRERPAGMIVESQARDRCVNIWKHVHWGTEWGASMDVYNPTGQGAEAMLHVAGANFTFRGLDGQALANQWVSTSDKRLKSNFEDINNAVDKVEKLTGYIYDKKSDLVETKHSFKVREAGIIAQDLQEVLPEAVSSFGEDEILSVNPAAVNALLVNAVKELSARTKDQQKQIDELKKLVEALISK